MATNAAASAASTAFPPSADVGAAVQVEECVDGGVQTVDDRLLVGQPSVGEPRAGSAVELAGHVAVVHHDEPADADPPRHDEEHVPRSRATGRSRCTSRSPRTPRPVRSRPSRRWRPRGARRRRCRSTRRCRQDTCSPAAAVPKPGRPCSRRATSNPSNRWTPGAHFSGRAGRRRPPAPRRAALADLPGEPTRPRRPRRTRTTVSPSTSTSADTGRARRTPSAPGIPSTPRYADAGTRLTSTMRS